MKTSEIIRFDRHEIFDDYWMRFHRDTINKLAEYQLDNDLGLNTVIMNYLYGIWDGYLYEEILSPEFDVPMNVRGRIKEVYDYIVSNI